MSNVEENHLRKEMEEIKSNSNLLFDTTLSSTSSLSVSSFGSNTKLSTLAYKYHMSNVLKDKYLFLFGNVPKQFIDEIEKIKVHILRIDPTYFTSQVNEEKVAISSSISRSPFISSSTITDSKFDSITNDGSVIECLKSSSTPLESKISSVSDVKSLTPFKSRSTISTLDEKSSTTKTVTFSTQVRDMYEELMKKYERKQEEKLFNDEFKWENKKFLSPREHTSNKARLNNNRKFLSTNYNQDNYQVCQMCSTCNQEITYYSERRRNNSTLANSSFCTVKPSITASKRTSFASKLSCFSCFSSPMTYEEYLLEK